MTVDSSTAEAGNTSLRGSLKYSGEYVLRSDMILRNYHLPVVDSANEVKTGKNSGNSIAIRYFIPDLL